MSNHAHLITSVTGVWLLKPEVFILKGPEARPEGRDQTTPTTTPSCSSRTSILNEVLTGHRKSSRSPQTIPHLSICVGPAHQTRSVQWLLNAQTRAAANVSIEKKQKTSVSKDCRYTKLKKEVTGDFFVCSCHTFLTATGPCNEHSM